MNVDYRLMQIPKYLKMIMPISMRTVCLNKEEFQVESGETHRLYRAKPRADNPQRGVGGSLQSQRAT